MTAFPPGPGATQRSSTAGVASDQAELHQNESHGEDVTQSPPVPGQRGQSEVVIRSQWHASAEEPGEGVTQLAAHGIADGKSLSQFWRAGDVGSIRSTAGLPISMAEFDNRRTVTIYPRIIILGCEYTATERGQACDVAWQPEGSLGRTTR